MSKLYGTDDDVYVNESHQIDISTTLFNSTRLSSVLYNASGVMCTEEYQLQSILDSKYTGAVVTKSCTLSPRKGNPEPRYSHSIPNVNNGSINSMGIPNHGVKYYMDCSKTVERHDKPFMLSISGLSADENIDLFNAVRCDTTHQISAIEFNLSCPNVIGKPQTSYDFDAMDNILRKVFDIFQDSTPSVFNICPVGLKLSPYFDPVHWQRAADVIDGYTNRLQFLTCSNSLGNGLLVDPDTETTLIYPKNGLGGCGGDFMRPIALSNVSNFYNLLGDKLDIIGCGGVSTGDDVFNLILAGAKAVQVGTLVAKSGVKQFKRLHDELKQRMLKNGYTNIEQFRGKLKTINMSNL